MRDSIWDYVKMGIMILIVILAVAYLLWASSSPCTIPHPTAQNIIDCQALQPKK